MGSPMDTGTLKDLSITCWRKLAVIVTTNFLLYLGQYSVFPVVVVKSLSETSNLGSCLYRYEPVLVWD